jgi:acyl dehydratase
LLNGLMGAGLRDLRGPLLPLLEHSNKEGLTGAMLAAVQSLEGMPLRIEQWNHEATRDAIRHWSWGIGDNNPLYCDPDYAAGTAYRGLVAPPTFLQTIYNGSISVALPGIQPYGGGSKWQYLEVVRRGDALTADAHIGPTKLVEGRHVQRLAIQTTLSKIVRDDGTVVATCEGRTLQAPRSGARGALAYEPRSPYVYSKEELESIRLQAVSEARRGAEPRLWDDVQIGERIPPVVKGPIDLSSMIAYYCGNPGTPRYKSVEMLWLYQTWATESPERLPNNFDPTYYAEAVSPSAGHVRDDVAHELGMPGAYNNGSQTTGWMAHPVTNWMGDLGFITDLEVRLRRPIVFGDTVWIRGVVTEKPERGVVLIELAAENQIGMITATGAAAVRLPRRDDE